MSLGTSNGPIHSDVVASTKDPSPSLSRESSFNDSVDLVSCFFALHHSQHIIFRFIWNVTFAQHMDIIDGKKKSTAIAPVASAAPSVTAASTAHVDLDSASFFGAKSGPRNRAQKSMLRYDCAFARSTSLLVHYSQMHSQSSPKLPSFTNTSSGSVEPELHHDAHASVEGAAPQPLPLSWTTCSSHISIVAISLQIAPVPSPHFFDLSLVVQAVSSSLAVATAAHPPGRSLPSQVLLPGTTHLFLLLIAPLPRFQNL